jgi:hypothetical protein
MAVIREVVVGGVAGHMVTAVMEKMIANIRESAIEDMLNYQHRASDIEEAPFFGVYSAPSLGEGTPARINRSLSAHPETNLHYCAVERVIVLSDDNPEEKPFSTRRVVGLVIMRHPDTGPFRPKYDQVQRFKVELQYGYAPNGNTYQFDTTVTDFKPVTEEDTALSQV